MCDTTNSACSSVSPVDVNNGDIQKLLLYFSKNTYNAQQPDEMSNGALEKCIKLMKIDYSLITVPNTNGELSTNYPSQILILEYELDHTTNVSGTISQPSRTTSTIYESMPDAQKLRDLISKASIARCRARFPVPVILYKGKYICRSATLSGFAEMFGRSGMNYVLYGSDNTTDNSNSFDVPMESEILPLQWDWQLCNRVRSQDIKLLKTLNVGTIVDFMVEKKKVKFGMYVTSSEKVDKENRYSDFNVISLPYPGCEFFKDFRDNNYIAEGLVFNWSQEYVNADLQVPEDPVTAQLRIEWENYKLWDLVHMTQNYMKLLLKYLQENSSGLLIHCISGWDRTPLFVSLLRISLWADGVAHQGLDACQILYLTIAYDWMLFGHHLTDRLDKGEEIFYFCFYMLKYLTQDEYSIIGSRYKSHKYSDRISDKGATRGEAYERSVSRADSDRSSGEKSVSRFDSDCQLDGVMFDQDLRGSNISLNSSSSSISSKSQEQPSILLHFLEDHSNGNPVIPVEVSNPLLSSVQDRRTSPVTVPVASRLRQRQESCSSVSTGSWQMITGTGSLRGSDSNSTHSTSSSNGTNINRDDIPASKDSSCTLIDEDSCFPGGYPNRKDRLLKIRELFYNCYSKTIGLKFKDGSDGSLTTFLGNIAGKVGLSPRM